MKNRDISSHSLLYISQADLEAFIQKNCRSAPPETQWLVCIHTCCHAPSGSLAIAKHVAASLPGAKIIGTSASAVIYHGTVYDDRCLLIFTRFSHTEIQVHPISFDGKSPNELAEITINHTLQSNTKAMFAFFTDQYMEIQAYLDKLQDHGTSIPVSGGMISKNLFGSFAFNETGIYQNSLMLGVLHSDRLRCCHSIIRGHVPFSETYTITETNKSSILQIDHTPAALWFRDKLGIADKENHCTLNRNLLLHFPLLLGKVETSSQFVSYCEPCSKIETYSSWIPSGTSFRLGYLSPLTAVSELKEICHMLETTPCQVIFAYPGTLRHTTLNHCTEWELHLFRSCRICGAFLYGEICMMHQKNVLHVGVNTLHGFAESDNDYLPIDRTLLENLYCLDEDWQNIYQYVEKMQQEQLSKKSHAFSQQILSQETALRNNMFMNKETRLENLVKFKYDDMENQYNKICMISIEKGILISGRRGTKVWNRLMQENIQQIKSVLQDEALHFYCNDTWTFFFTAGIDYPDERFLQKAETAFRECGYYFCKEYNITAVNTFHVVIGETNLLEKVQLCMSSQTDHNARFFVYNKDNAEMIKQMDEKLFMTNVISDAILYDRIVPYFQPIRDNRTKKITKYEALMRLSDKDHNIYAPGQFLEIAKDYHLYLQLSQLMIQKVLELFRDRTETVFLNLSAYDISSETNRSFLYDLLSELPPEACERITFEILESEKIRDFQEMVCFLNDIRKFGVKIAIDDFGAGFSNFTAIIRVNPDFIKIDGDLIINCDKDPVKKICLQAITDIARGVDAELIAEHVENSGEQETVESVNIEYTQGYYFSKPLPYDSLNEDSESS